MRKTILLALACTMLPGSVSAKKILGHDDFDRWEKVSNHSINNQGTWASYSVNPQEGDGTLYFYNVGRNTTIALARGYRPAFTADGKWAVALVKPFFQETRKARIAKKKDLELPQDSLAIINLTTGKVEKVGNVLSYAVPAKGGHYVAWTSCDTTLAKPKVLKDKKGGKPLVVVDLNTSKRTVVPNVGKYVFDEKGTHLGVVQNKAKADSLSKNATAVLRTADGQLRVLDEGKSFYGTPVFDREGGKMAFTLSSDSTETGTRRCAVMMADLSDPDRQLKNIDLSEVAGRGLYANQYTTPEFSYNGKRLIAGVAREIAPDDTTLVKFERPGLDIWRWDAPYTPPQENNMVESLRKQTFPVVVDLSTGKGVLVTDNPLVRIAAPDRWDGDWALLTDISEHGRETQWNYQYPVRLKLKNIADGREKEIGEVPRVNIQLSPSDRYVVWFADREYHSYDIATGTVALLGKDVDAILWNEDTDTPMKQRDPYGTMGWTAGDGRILVYDRFDVWSLDPKGKEASVNITAGEGRKRNLAIRYVRTDWEQTFIADGQKTLYSLFDYTDKRNGLASAVFTGKPAAPKVDFLDAYTFRQIQKAKDADVYDWVQANFDHSPNVYVSRGLVASKTVKVSDSNPQMAEYNWGTAQLFKWHAYDGKPSEGVLYLPEDFDPDKEYPMLVYFYETYSQDLYVHYDMEPSWSWINFPFYVSRGYVVFVPDIHYTAGIPGENAYNYICSGTEAVLKAYPNIDPKRIGIDGQSWGGYQTAFLVTRTDMFACAGSGAPVSNMTSAFGGIRWGSGDSRQAQYEVGQSRIGRNLWEAPELYIANSPVFHANRCHTPLLIMHNDDDGAVPWYQGIEMFMALRRLQKPVWMLQYNGEAHNLKERRNRKDITRRLQQFFDHYLKGDPMPEWMKNGIPAVRKGQELGY